MFIIIRAHESHASVPLLEPLVTAATLHSYRPLPPQPGHVEDAGIMSVLQTIRTSLLRLESSLFAPPCNATTPFAVDCAGNATAEPHAGTGRADWLGRHHFGLRRQILSYEPRTTPEMTPPLGWEDATPEMTPPLGWEDATPGPDGFYDSAPDPDLPPVAF